MGWIAAQLASWSAAQWTAGTAVIAFLVALYGAGLSTLNFLRAGPKLRFNAWVDRGIMLQIDATNYGGRSTTLTKIVIRYFENPRSWARLRNRATRTSLFIDPNQPFPHELQPGGLWSGRLHMDRGTTGALYLDLYHSHSTKPVRTRVRDKSTLPPGLHFKRFLGRLYPGRADN
jgi:hypothetical protein